MLPHPQYPHQRHIFHIYDIGDGDRAVRFAAGELLLNAWAFYAPKN